VAQPPRLLLGWGRNLQTHLCHWYAAREARQAQGSPAFGIGMVHGRARVHQHFHALDVPLLAREEQRGGAVGALHFVAGRFRVDVSAPTDEELEAHEAPTLRGYHEWGEARRVGLSESYVEKRRKAHRGRS